MTTVRDFTQVFDAYAQFEELSLSKRMEEAAKNPTEDGTGHIYIYIYVYIHIFNYIILFSI